MALDIKALKLTDEEMITAIEKCHENHEGTAGFTGRQLDEAVADAQWRKVLEGMVEWLATQDELYARGTSWKCVHLEMLWDQLLAEGQWRK